MELNSVIVRCERSEPRRMHGPAGGRASFETRFALLRMTEMVLLRGPARAAYFCGPDSEMSRSARNTLL